jgi:probable O-glycosylation ligase (exosortase A-associated)
MATASSQSGDFMKAIVGRFISVLSQLDTTKHEQIANNNKVKIIVAIGLSCVLSAIWFVVPHPVVIAVLAIIPIALVLVLKLPFMVCLGFILFSFFRLHEAFPMLMPFKIPLLMALASLTALGWHLVITRSIKPFLTPELTWFLIFFIIVTIGIAFASNRGVAIAAYTGSYVKMAIMVFAIAWLIRTEKEFAMACNMIVICGIAIALVALNNKANGIGLVEGTRVTIGRNIGSILGDPNDLALVLSLPISFATGLAVTKNRGALSRCLGVLGYILIACAIIATQSRGGLLAIVAVSSVFAFYKIRSKLLVICLGGIGLLILLVFAGISDRSSGGAEESGVDASAQGRLYAWQAAFKMANTHPFSGVGLDNFTSNYFFYSPHWDGMNHAVHSTWFGVLAETGYVGLCVFLVLVFKTVKFLYQTVNRLKPLYEQGQCSPILFCSAQSVLAGLAGFIASGTFLTQGFTWPLYILLALSIAVQQQAIKVVGE